MGSETKEADIIVYTDNECEETYILIEIGKERSKFIAHINHTEN